MLCFIYILLYLTSKDLKAALQMQSDATQVGFLNKYGSMRETEVPWVQCLVQATQQQCQLVLEPSLPIHLVSPQGLLLSPYEQIFLQPDLITVANTEGSH